MSRKADADSEEEGELKDLHPLATVTDINPEDIPDVPFNKFLMRGPQEKEKDKKFKRKERYELGESSSDGNGCSLLLKRVVRIDFFR
jgi:hypothetical protein